MAGVREVRAIGPSAPLTDVRSSAQRTVNMYLAPTESPGEDREYILRSCPAAVSVVTCSGELRGMCSSPDGAALFYVDGNSVKELRTSGTTTHTGTLSTSTGPVSMAYGSGDKIVLVTGTNGYVIDATANTVTEITDADFPDTATQVAYLDGYWIVNAPAVDDQWQISALDDPTSWDALDFTSADRIPDAVVAIRVSKQEIYLFGKRSTEIWVNTGGADFPFSRYTQAPIDIGIIGPYAACTTTDSLAFVGRAANGVPMVYLFNGHTPMRISTRAVEEALARLSFAPATSGVRVWSYQSEGAEFIGVDLADPSVADDGKLGSTWVYDLTTRQWHERKQGLGGLATTQLEALDVVMYNGAPHMGLHYFESTGPTTFSWRIFQLSSTGAESDGSWGELQTMRRERTWPHLVAPSIEPVKYASLELVCNAGSSGTVSLEISNDGGLTFGSPISRSLGSDTMQRVRWQLLGQSRDRVFRVSCASDVGFNIYSANLEIGQ